MVLIQMKIFKKELFLVTLFTCFVVTESAAPVFTTPVSPGRSVPVSESLPVGTSVYQVVAIDADADVLVYSITSQTPATQQKFEINSRTGLISSIEEFDVDSADAVDLYEITIRVTDGSSNVLTTLLMRITDENDNSPVFSHYHVIRQKTKPGFIVADVKAVDVDRENNGLVVYKITDGNTDKAFGIDSSTGVLYTMYELDRSSRDLYNLVIEARDSGATPRSATVTLTVTVTGYQDNGSSTSAFSNVLLLVLAFLKFTVNV